MRIWVTGASGLLGRYVCEAVKKRGYYLLATSHWECPIEHLGIVHRAARDKGLDAIINCAGKTTPTPAIETLLANSLGPHILATLKIRMVHMSTDCVFSGKSGQNRSKDNPDPTGIYGRSKLAGEVDAPHVLNVRGSFISKEGGFLFWLLNATGKIEAWRNADWNGTTAEIMADKLVELAEGEKVGVVHAASSEMVSKAWLVHLFAERLSLPVEIEDTDVPSIGLALTPDVMLPPIVQVMEDYAKELQECLVRA